MTDGLTVSMSPETSEKIAGVARSQRVSVTAVMQKALQLLLVAEEARRDGRSLGVIDADKRLVAEIVDF